MIENKKALIVINAQNDYLKDGRYPLYNIDETIKNIGIKIVESYNQGDLIVFIQHISPLGAAFFEDNTEGAELIPSISKLAKSPIIIQKRYASGFDETDLSRLLDEHNIKELTIVGMMTQNCVLFTAISDSAKKYRTTIISNCCTSVTPVIHAVAVRGLSRIPNIQVI